MVKKSNLKMGIVPKLTHKKTPDISHLTGVQCFKGCCNYPPIEAHGSPTKKELITALVKERKELLKQSRKFTNFTSYRVRFDTYLRLKAVNYLLNRFGI